MLSDIMETNIAASVRLMFMGPLRLQHWRETGGSSISAAFPPQPPPPLPVASLISTTFHVSLHAMKRWLAQFWQIPHLSISCCGLFFSGWSRSMGSSEGPPIRIRTSVAPHHRRVRAHMCSNSGPARSLRPHRMFSPQLTESDLLANFTIRNIHEQRLDGLAFPAGLQLAPRLKRSTTSERPWPPLAPTLMPRKSASTSSVRLRRRVDEKRPQEPVAQVLCVLVWVWQIFELEVSRLDTIDPKVSPGVIPKLGPFVPLVMRLILVRIC